MLELSIILSLFGALLDDFLQFDVAYGAANSDSDFSAHLREFAVAVALVVVVEAFLFVEGELLIGVSDVEVKVDEADGDFVVSF